MIYGNFWQNCHAHYHALVAYQSYQSHNSLKPTSSKKQKSDIWVYATTDHQDHYCHTDVYNVRCRDVAHHATALHSSSPGQNGRIFVDGIVNAFSPINIYHILWMNIRILCYIMIRISLMFVQVMVWRRADDKTLPVPMLSQFTGAYIRCWGMSWIASCVPCISHTCSLHFTHATPLHTWLIFSKTGPGMAKTTVLIP